MISIGFILFFFVSLKTAGVAVGFVGLFGYIVGEMCANLIMPMLAETFSWNASLMFLAALSVVAGALYLSLRGREVQTVHVSSTSDAGGP
jgi:OPA family glycerol-3-phosphate transporter-like MFS transporter